MERASKELISNLKKQKREKSLLFLDNVKIIKDALPHINVKLILTTVETLPFEVGDIKVYKTDAKTIEMLADTVTPQGVLCVAEFKKQDKAVPNGNFLVLDTLQDPGNVGTLIRTSVACNFSAVFLVDCVHVTNPKLIRSSVGAVFNQKIYEMSKEEFVKFAILNNLPLAKCDMNGENIFTKKFEKPIGIVVGNEGQGVSEEISKLSKISLSIPMKGNIESLNAGVSGSIIMYQIAKENLIWLKIYIR